MELRQLEHFLAVAEEGSFTRAAARVFMVQSSLSASILSLERELGAELFIRGRRGAELTDAGRAFLAPARAAVEAARQAQDAVAEVRGVLRGSVRMAVVVAPRAADVVEALRSFQQDHPEVRVHLVPSDERTMAELVTSGQVDFAVTPRPERLGPGFVFEPVQSTPLVVSCPADHRLAGATDVDPQELLDESIIDLSRTWQSRTLFDRVLQERGVQRRVRLEVDDWFRLLALVQRGVGISYGPEACIDRIIFPGLAVATLAGAPPWEVGVAYRGETLRGAAGRAFLTAYRRQWRARTRALEDDDHGSDDAAQISG